jgi:GH15 family glucan-1,4-alpha-glucosidase
MAEAERYHPIGEYAFISDCHCAALISREGSVDWCCMPRFDSGSAFGRLLDADRDGFCSIASNGLETFRRYLGDSLVLETTFKGPGGEARLIDCMTMRAGGAREPYRQLLRVVEGVRGWLRFHLRIAPRLDYGEVEPWLHRRGIGAWTAMGGNDGLLISGDVDLGRDGAHQLAASFALRAGQRVHLSVQYQRPEGLDRASLVVPTAAELDCRLKETMEWWRAWSSRMVFDSPDAPAANRSAIVLKGLQDARTGAIVAAPMTGLPETPGGERNWDYRYSWVRDSAFTVRSLAALGRDAEPDAFRLFVERSAAGGTASLQIVYGVGGERHLTERTLDGLEGYWGARPVRVGNAGARQVQLDVYGELLALAGRWHRRGSSLTTTTGAS